MKTQGLEIYVHIPFCVKKCNYCDFLSGPASEERMREYTCALQREIDAVQEGKTQTVTSIFVGGGTPSILPVDMLSLIMRTLKKKYQISPDAEISLEANPGTLCFEHLREYRQMGFNRLSIGLQSADDRELKYLGRIHSYEEFVKNYEDARKAGFENINVDLMMALPGSSHASWLQTLKRTAELSPEHISAYSLIVEEGTPFAKMELDLPDEDTEYAMYENTRNFLSENGYHPYEISNYAKNGKECRHNCGYWTRAPYLGFGLGSSSLYEEKRFHNTSDFDLYLSQSHMPISIREECEILCTEDQMAETMFLGLRMTQGVSKRLFLEKFGITIEEKYKDVIQKYSKMDLLREDDDRVYLSPAGIHVSNRIMADFLPD